MKLRDEKRVAQSCGRVQAGYTDRMARCAKIESSSHVYLSICMGHTLGDEINMTGLLTETRMTESAFPHNIKCHGPRRTATAVVVYYVYSSHLYCRRSWELLRYWRCFGVCITLCPQSSHGSLKPHWLCQTPLCQGRV